jgi:uncharacterized protein YfaA (DUF2138 family)
MVRIVKTIGKVYPKDHLFLTKHVGTADGTDDKPVYELKVGGTSLAPMLTSTKTGKTFALSWDDIIALARKAGIDKK